MKRKMEILIGVLVALLAIAVGACIIFAVNTKAAEDNYDEIYVMFVEAKRSANSNMMSVKKLQNKYDILNAKYTALLRQNFTSNINSQKAEENAAETKIESPAEIKEETEIFSFENTHTNVYRCMGYDALTNPKSDQYILQQFCKTDASNGIRYYESDGIRYYTAAMGGAYGYEIGTAYRVTLRNGHQFNVMLGDYKHPMYQDGYESDHGDEDVNYQGDRCVNVIEFIVEMDVVPVEVMRAGTMSALDEFGGISDYSGDIVSIAKIGKVWER